MNLWNSLNCILIGLSKIRPADKGRQISKPVSKKMLFADVFQLTLPVRTLKTSTMIQRIQSIWLILAAVASFLTLRLSFFSGNIVGADNVKTFTPLTATSNLVILIFTVATGIAA